ncbi:hypothetical protein B0T26DRAFT_433829 [Lasiosphaeria miniovina]|uniref:Uncharacterized protein n=1 Tax=Lasiosphaeria miniovina TaxID=1954250 RepID=A0AA40DQW5_9PEZI|nr:uncharacterized protein B0T26DRAFT_433829 [Lasiosphaeria miniovina]KAK0710166.1 hypothetical protein B0T26DRAFT_433829 [Lasiosphaeria miniovina]
MWWTEEVDSSRRMVLRQGGLDSLMSALVARFAPDAGTSNDRCNKGRLNLHHIYEDEAAAIRFVQQKLRYAHGAGILLPDNSNWLGVMQNIWGRFDVEIMRFIRGPLPVETLANYMFMIVIIPVIFAIKSSRIRRPN